MTRLKPGTIHISVGGPQRVITDARGKRWDFEDHPRFGPQVTNRRGDILTKQPGERSAFWDAWGAWKNQGKNVAADGLTCVWAP